MLEKSGEIWEGLEGDGGSSVLRAGAEFDGTWWAPEDGDDDFAVEVEVRGGTFQAWGMP